MRIQPNSYTFWIIYFLYFFIKLINIETCYIIKDNAPFAFCEYFSDKFAKRAIREKNLVIDGNRLVMKLISKEFKDNYYKQQNMKKIKVENDKIDIAKQYELCIKGLPDDFGEVDVLEFFGKYGQIQNLTLLKKILFICFQSENVAKNLVKKGTLNYKGHILTIKYSKEKEFKDKDSFKQKDINKQNNCYIFVIYSPPSD